MPKSLGKKLPILFISLFFIVSAVLGVVLSPALQKNTSKADVELNTSTANNAIKYDRNNNEVSDASVLSVSKVSIREQTRTSNVDGETVYNYIKRTDILHDVDAVSEPLIYTNASNIPFIMLNTEANGTPQSRDGILIEFGVTGGKVRLFSRSISLNGVELATNEFIYPDESSGEQNQSFRQYIHALTPNEVNENDLHYTYKTYSSGTNTSENGDLNFGNEIATIEGLYEISFKYRMLSQIDDLERTATFKFYLVTEETYNQMNENLTFAYTEKYDYTTTILQLTNSTDENDKNTLKDTLYSKQHLFKFTNVYTSIQRSGAFSGTKSTDYTIFSRDSSNIPSTLHYPTITFNPEKYHISYTRTLYNKQESYDLSFTTRTTFINQVASEQGVLTISKTVNSVTTTNTRYIEKSESGTYSITLTLDEVGEYVFNKYCILRTGVGSYVDASNIQLSDITLTMPETLSINGFQATYSTPDGDVELRNDFYDTDINGTLLNKYTADFTFQNKEMAINVSDNTSASYYLTGFEPKEKEIFAGILRGDSSDGYGIKIATTNQAPVKFIYNATLDNDKSWYIFYDTKGVRTVGKWTKSTKFERAGTYVVYTVFTNTTPTGGYTTFASGQTSNITQVGQVFVFKITNTPPAVTIYTIDNGKSASDIQIDNTNTLSVNGFTNKNVYIKWPLAGPFDTTVFATYSITNFKTGATEISNASYNGLKIKSVDEFSYIYGDKNNTTVFTANGIYTVKIYYTNSKQSSLSLNFTIDKEQISGIKALKVNASTQMLDGADPNSTTAFNLDGVTISSLQSFNLTTTNSFMWTWDTKASGAEITAQYTYSALSEIANFEVAELTSGANIWVTANGQFGTFAPFMTYRHTIVTTENANNLTFLSTQICSTARLQLLLLSDAAGNKAIFITILEDVEPEMIQQAVGEAPANLNVISKNTKFTWGTHKALLINTDENKMDIGDILNDGENNFISDYNENFDRFSAIKNSLNSYVSQNGENLYMTIKIKEVSFQGSGGDMGGGDYGSSSDSKLITFSQPNENSVISQTFIWLVIDTENHLTYLSISPSEPFEVYRNTVVVLNANQGDEADNLPDFYTYTINLKDVSDNKMLARTVEVNFDKSLGTMFSHYGTLANDKVHDTLTKLENGESINRIRLQQNRSTNRQYVTFSFRQQESGSDFEVQEVYLYFYPLDLNNIHSENYPYTTEPLLTGDAALIYKIGETNSMFRELSITTNGVTETYYQSYALQRLNYSSTFQGSASQDGKYVFVRKYKSDFVDGTEGDVKDRTYTYYVDRGKVLNGIAPATTYLKFGYDQGTYLGYDDYGGTTFSSFENSVYGNYDTFNHAFNFDGRIYQTQTPVVSSNILPVGLELFYAISAKYNSAMSNKFIYPEVDSDIVNSMVDKLQSMNLLALVTYSSKPQNATSRITLYNHFTSSDKTENIGSNGTAFIKNITKLSEEFTSVGYYRIMLFDLSNLSGTINGYYNDIRTYLTYNKKTNYQPNYAIINFCITGKTPVASFQQKTGSSNYVATSSGDTKSDYVRLMFTDTSDKYQAKIAYNNVSVTRRLISINNEAGTLSRPVTMSNPIFVTDDVDYYKNLLGLGDEEVEELANNVYNAENNIIYSKDYAVLNYTLTQLLTFTNASYSSATDFTEENKNYVYLYTLVEGATDRYSYYLYLPPTPTVNGYDVQMDCEYVANYHYIGNSEIYKVGESYANYQSSSKVYVDHTSPYKNLKALISSDEYLEQTGLKNDILNNLYDLDYEFLKTYAFAVNQSYRPQSFDNHENQESFYVRGPYNKYDYSSTEYMQMVVEGMEDYEKNTGAEKFLESKFLDNSNPKYKRYTYNVASNAPFQQEGYYDIIERDSVENYRVYTVYVKTTFLSASAVKSLTDESSYEINEITAADEAGSVIYYNNALVDQYGDESLAQSISSETFILTSINTSDRWFTISYRNVALNQNAPYTTINITPSVDIAEVLATLNQEIVQICDANRYLAGSKIEILIKNRVGLDLKFYLKTPGQRLTPTFAQVDSRHFSMTMPTNTASTQLIKPSEFATHKFTVMLNGAPYTAPDPINDTEPYTYIFEYPANGNYTFTFIDNFGQSYILTYPIDTSLIKELVFAEGAVKNYVYNGVIHSLDYVTLRFQSNTFRNISVKIADRENSNSILIDTGIVDVSYFTATNDDTTYWTIYQGKENDKESVIASINQTGIVELTFKAIKNSYYLYTIDINDGTLTNAEQYIFALYTYLPEVKLTDTSDVEIWQEGNEKTTSKNVKINWTVLSDKLFNPYVSIEFPSGRIDTILPPYVLSEEGTYTVRVGSDLGVAISKTIRFTIQEYDISIFGVYLNGKLLEPHPNLNSFTFSYTYEEDDIFGEGTTTLTKTMEQFFFYAQSATRGWENITVSSNEDKDLQIKLAATLGNTRIYRVWGSTTHTIENFYAVTLIPYAGSTLTTMTIDDGSGNGDENQSQNSSKLVTLQQKDISHYEKHAQNKTCSECAPPIIVKWTTAFYDSSYSSTNPFVYSNFVFLDLYYNGDFVGTYNSGQITITKSGTYTIQIRNFVGQQHMFNVVYNSFTLTVLYDVIYLVNGKTPVQNAVYNDTVTLNLHDVSYYTMTSFRYEVYKNNVLVDRSHYNFSNNVFTFREPAVYKVVLSVRVRGEQNKYIYGEANFSILNSFEAKTAYEFTKISGYKIVKVLKQGDEQLDSNGNVVTDENGNIVYTYSDITSSLLAEGETTLYSTLLSKETTGVGRFVLTIETESVNMTPSQTYTFSIWINDETPILTPSREYGSSSTASVTINYNKALIYQQIGTCSIVINGNEFDRITRQDIENSAPQSITLTVPNDYYIQVYSESGFLVMSQRVTITTPLNTASIILIVVAVVVVVGVTLTFVLLRTRMRVK